MPRRIDLGRAVLVAGAAVLFVSLFLKWYDTGPTGWEVFETLDLVLAALAVAGLAAALRPDLAPPWTIFAVPGAAIVIVVVQLLNAPPAAGDGDPSTGLWLALAGSVLMGAGAALSLADISVTVQVREREVRRRVPAVDRRETAAAPDPGDGTGVGGPELELDDLAEAPRAGEAPEPGPPTTGPPPAEHVEPGDLQRTQPLPPLDEPEEGTHSPR